jgi:hypothetical protein
LEHPIQRLASTNPILTVDFMPKNNNFKAAERRALPRKGASYIQKECLGKWCWQNPKFNGLSFCHYHDQGTSCPHTFAEWMTGCSDWQSRFALEGVPGMGYGVVSKYHWDEDDVLGAYVGKLIPMQTENTDYCHEVHIGAEFAEKEAEVAYVDAEECGNWTRFVNHSCANNAHIVEARVGDTRVLALVATKEIMPGDIVTIDYQDDYFRERDCLCRDANCRYPPEQRRVEPVARISHLFETTDADLRVQSSEIIAETILQIRLELITYENSLGLDERDTDLYILRIDHVCIMHAKAFEEGHGDWPVFCRDLVSVENDQSLWSVKEYPGYPSRNARTSMVLASQTYTEASLGGRGTKKRHHDDEDADVVMDDGDDDWTPSRRKKKSKTAGRW